MQATGQIGRVPQMSYNGHVFATKVSHLVGGHQLWSNLERDEFYEFKAPKTNHMMDKLKKHFWWPKLWHMTVSDGKEWWTAQHIGTPMTPSMVKGERSKFQDWDILPWINQEYFKIIEWSLRQLKNNPLYRIWILSKLKQKLRSNL